MTKTPLPIRREKKVKFEFVRPLMSWERPIEDECINYCLQMAEQLQSVADHHREWGWFANNTLSNKAEGEATAFRMVAKWLEREKKLRENIKNKEEK